MKKIEYVPLKKTEETYLDKKYEVIPCLALVEDVLYYIEEADGHVKIFQYSSSSKLSQEEIFRRAKGTKKIENEFTDGEAVFDFIIGSDYSHFSDKNTFVQELMEQDKL